MPANGSDASRKFTQFSIVDETIARPRSVVRSGALSPMKSGAAPLELDAGIATVGGDAEVIGAVAEVREDGIVDYDPRIDAVSI